MRHIKRNRFFWLGFFFLGVIGIVAVSFTFFGSTSAQTLVSKDKELEESSGQHAPADVPPGFSAIYVFSGARDDSGSGGTKSGTSVHCTNLGGATVNVYVELADYDYTPVYTGTFSLAPNNTVTISSRSTAVYDEDITLDTTADDIDQGFGRISIDSNQPVICTAQVLDPTNNPPNFIVNLDMFTP